MVKKVRRTRRRRNRNKMISENNFKRIQAQRLARQRTSEKIEFRANSNLKDKIVSK